MAERKRTPRGVTNSEEKETKRTTARTRKKSTKPVDTEVEKVEGEVIRDEFEKEETLTPAQYFEKIKSLSDTLNTGNFKTVVEIAKAKMNQFKMFGQTEAAKTLNNYITMYQKEIAIIEAGFNTYILKKDVEKYISKISQKAVYVCELADYPREIPEDVANKIMPYMTEKGCSIFDHIYIIFTDYTGEEAKQIDKKTREKDPIMFGAVEKVRRWSGDIELSPRLYFIGDWTDEQCDLTFDKIIEGYEANGISKDEIVHELKAPETSAELTAAVNTYNKELNDSVVDGDANYAWDNIGVMKE